MPRINTTTRLGATAVAASLVTALAGPGGAGAIEIHSPVPTNDPLLEAIKQDVKQAGATVHNTADQIAPSTRAWVKETADQTLADTQRIVDKAVSDAKNTVDQTTSDAKNTVDQTTSDAKSTVDRAGREADRIVHRTSDLGGRTLEYARETTGRAVGRTTSRAIQAYGDTQRSARRARRDAESRVARTRVSASQMHDELVAQATERAEQTLALVSGGSIRISQKLTGCWTMSWSSDLRNISVSLQAGC